MKKYRAAYLSELIDRIVNGLPYPASVYQSQWDEFIKGKNILVAFTCLDSPHYANCWYVPIYITLSQSKIDVRAPKLNWHFSGH